MSPHDPSISYPLMDQEITVVTLFICAVFVPLVFIFGFSIYSYRTGFSPSPIRELDCALRSFVFCIVGVLLITDFVKRLVGRPRPNFVALAQYDWTTETTNATASDVRNAYMSFISGHSSLSFAGLGWLALWLHSKLSEGSDLHNLTLMRRRDGIRIAAQASRVNRDGNRRSDRENESAKDPYRITGRNQIWRTAFSFAPVFLAGWIAISRVRDYWHREVDVAIGSLVGTAVAFVTFGVHYYQMRWVWLGTPPPGTDEVVGASAALADVGLSVGVLVNDVDEIRPNARAEDDWKSLARGDELTAPLAEAEAVARSSA